MQFDSTFNELDGTQASQRVTSRQPLLSDRPTNWPVCVFEKLDLTRRIWAGSKNIYSLLYQKLGGHTVWGIRLLHCTRLLGTRIFCWIWGENGIWKSSDRIWACSRLFFFPGKWQSRILEANFGILEALREHWGVLKAGFFLKNRNLGFWKPSESIGACSRLLFFLAQT